jgi:hypothetical protein
MGPYFDVSMRGCKPNNQKSIEQFITGLDFDELVKDN